MELKASMFVKFNESFALGGNLILMYQDMLCEQDVVCLPRTRRQYDSIWVIKERI